MAIPNSLSHLFHYEVWLPTTRPLFLLMLRWSVQGFRPSDFVFRAIPVLLAPLSLALLAWLSRLVFRTPFAVLCTALLDDRTIVVCGMPSLPTNRGWESSGSHKPSST